MVIKSHSRILSFILIMCLLLASGNVAKGQSLTQSPFERTIVLQVNPSEELINKLDQYGEVVSLGNYIRLVLPEGISRASVIDTLRKWQDIIYVSEAKPYTGLYEPNDPFYGPTKSEQWYIPSIQADSAWDLTKGDPSVIVAVVDTGLDLNHPDLQGQWVNGYNVLDPASSPQDDNGHGTHVSGIIAAVQNNSIGVTGLAPNSKIMPIKALDQDGLGDDIAIALGIRWAVDHGAKIINLSLGTPLNPDGTYSQSAIVNDAVRYALQKGILFIAAAGNDGVGSLSYPAALPGIISVGSTNVNNGRSSFSNYGSTLSLVAPGEYIQNTFPLTLAGSNAPYAYISGTSMASSVVSSVAALIWAANPTWNRDQVITKLLASTIDTQGKGRTSEQGFGKVDAGTAVLPTVTPISPLSNAYLNNVNEIKASFDSISLIQPASVQIKVDNLAINTTLKERDVVAYTSKLSDGVHRVDLLYKDKAGQDHTFSWSFTLESTKVPERLWGDDRIGTSIAISRQGWPYGSSTVYLNGYEDWPDALASIPLAFKDNAPLLLTYNDTLDSRVQTEINRLKPAKIILLGGAGVITDEIKKKLQGLYPQALIERIGGADRFETASLLAQRLRSSRGEAVLASGLDFADALSAAPYAARQGIPILLTNPDDMPDATRDTYNALHIKKTYVIGGTASVSDALYRTLNTPSRYGGLDRFGTAAKVNSGLMGSSSIGYFVTNGYGFPDSLSVAVLSARIGFPLLPVTSTGVPDATRQYMQSLPVQPQQKIAIGGPGVVSVLP